MDRREQRDKFIAQAAGVAVAAVIVTSDLFAIEWAVAAGVICGAIVVGLTSLLLARARRGA